MAAHPLSLLAGLRGRLRALLRRGDVEGVLSDEIRFHLEMETERRIQAGMSPEEARRTALIAFGGVERVREDHRDARGVRWLDDAIADIRYALRWLRRSPGFTIAATLTLALGIGGMTSMVSVVNGVLVKPLPYPDAGRLVGVWSRLNAGTGNATSSPPDLREFRARTRAFDAVAGYYVRPANVLAGAEPMRVQAARVTPDLLPMLGANLAHGRTFRADEDQFGNHRVVILGNAAWQTRFGGRADIVGSSLVVNEEPHVVIGVLEPGFRFLDGTAEIWLPFSFAADDNLNTRGNYFVNAVGRLKAGTDTAAARADLERVVALIRAEVPQAVVTGAAVVPLQEQIVGSSRRALMLLLAATTLLLVIACANVAGLLLARSAGRERELAVRAGLGASRGRLMRQLITEGLALGAIGAVAGLAVAFASLRAIRALGPQGLPRLDEVGLDGRVLLVAIAASLIAALTFGLFPALRLTHVRHEALRSGTRASGGQQRARRLLVAGQVALALVLLIGSGLLLRSFIAMSQVDPGFHSSNIVTASLPLGGTRYDDETQLGLFNDRLLEALRRNPLVQSAALTSGLALRGGDWGKIMTLADRPMPVSQEEFLGVNYRLVTNDYFATLGARLIAGRTFQTLDGRGTQDVAVVNEAFARRFYPGESVLGRVIWMGPPEELIASLLPPGYRFPRLTIIGVVADERFAGLDVAPQAEVFRLFSQSTETPSTEYLIVRSTAPPSAIVAHMRSSLSQADPGIPLAEVATMETLLSESGARRRFSTMLVGSFATLALLLAVVGVYGVAAHFVTQRTRELGIRMALGADSSRVTRLVLREGSLTALAGGVIGFAVAWASAGVMRDLLFGITPNDPVTWAGIGLLLLVVVLLAAWIPARRATRIPPGSVLQAE